MTDSELDYLLQMTHDVLTKVRQSAMEGTL